MKKFYFNTGVKPGIPDNEKHKEDAKPIQLCKGQVWHLGTKQIPFECENVPDNAIFMYAADDPNLHNSDQIIVREIHNSTLHSKYAYFKLP